MYVITFISLPLTAMWVQCDMAIISIFCTISCVSIHNIQFCCKSIVGSSNKFMIKMRNLMINNFLNNFANLLSEIICVLIFIAFAKMSRIPLKLRFFYRFTSVKGGMVKNSYSSIWSESSRTARRFHSSNIQRSCQSVELLDIEKWSETHEIVVSNIFKTIYLYVSKTLIHQLINIFSNWWQK